MDPKFSWQSFIFSNIQHKKSLGSCQFNKLALDKRELPEPEALRPTNHLLNQAWAPRSICLLVAPFSWIQGLAEVCGDSASTWELRESLPDTRADPHPLGELAASLNCLEAAQDTTYSHNRLETERKHLDYFFFFFPAYKRKATFRISILLASYTFPFSALGGKQKHFQHSH